MTKVYHINTIIGKLWTYFSNIFKSETNPTFQHLFDLILSILALDGYQSVKFNFEHFIKEDTPYHLKSYYFTLNESRIDMDEWTRMFIRTALHVLPVDNEQPLILSVDDTMIEKSGRHFEHCSKLYDHAMHNGSHYLYGHCFVSVLLSIPVCDIDNRHYIHIPVGCRMWTKEKSKLEIATELVELAMDAIGSKHSVYLCCDSWYPKGEVLSLPGRFENLEMICSVRSDTVLYDLPPARTGKRGRPRVYGEKLSLEDFELREVPGSSYQAGCRKVLTNLWGTQEVFAIVTQPLSGGSKRLFLSSRLPKKESFEAEYLPTSAQTFTKADPMLLPLAMYSLRWNIEIAFYEQKMFWSLGNYKLQSRVGMERLLNLLGIVYASMKLLSYWDPTFAGLKTSSPQQIRFFLGDLIRKERFLSALANQSDRKNIHLNLAECFKYLTSALFSVA